MAAALLEAQLGYLQLLGTACPALHQLLDRGAADTRLVSNFRASSSAPAFHPVLDVSTSGSVDATLGRSEVRFSHVGGRLRIVCTRPTRRLFPALVATPIRAQGTPVRVSHLQGILDADPDQFMVRGCL